jgi:hypothetical protein
MSNTFIGSRRNSPITIDYLNLIKVAGYQDQFLRPNVTTMTGTAAAEIGNMIRDFNGKIPGSVIAKTTANFILPSSRPETLSFADNVAPNAVSIPFGWNEDRFVFMMQIRTTSGNIETTELVTGYTDRFDVAHTNQYVHNTEDVIVAPDTVFYINSVSTIGTRYLNNIAIPVIKDSFSVFGGGLGTATYNSQNALKMTPMNLIQSGKINTIDGITDIPDNSGVTTIRSDYKSVSNYPTLSYRKFNSPTALTSKIIESYADQAKLFANSGSYSSDDVYNQARGACADPSITQTKILTSISTMGGSSSTFDYKWLQSIDPDIDNKTDVFDSGYHTTEYSAPWDAPTLETQMALVASNMVTTLMLNYSLRVLEFSSTNMMVNHGGFGASSDSAMISNISGFVENINFNNIIGSLENIIGEELGMVLSQGGEIGYAIHVSAEMNADINITISFEGRPEEIYIFPSFADSALSPMITTNTKTYRNNSRDIGAVMDLVEDTVVTSSGIVGYNGMGDVFSQMNSGHNPTGNVY